jgi:hypothetical protein
VSAALATAPTRSAAGSQIGCLPQELTAAERVALEAITTLEPNSGSYRLARQALRRFIVPLTQASQFLALGPSVRRCVQRVVLRGMLTNATAYGAWDAATWLTVSDAAGCFRSNVLGVAHWLGALSGEEVIAAGVHATYLARRLFGQTVLEHEIDRVRTHLRLVGYAHTSVDHATLSNGLAVLFVQVGRAELEALTIERIEAAYRSAPASSDRRKAFYRLAHALHGMGLLPRGIAHGTDPRAALVGVDPVWASWCARWRATATVAPRTTTAVYYAALKPAAGSLASTLLCARLTIGPVTSRSLTWPWSRTRTSATWRVPEHTSNAVVAYPSRRKPKPGCWIRYAPSFAIYRSGAGAPTTSILAAAWLPRALSMR